MGRATWASLPARFRPLPGRDNIVLTRSPGYEAAGALVVHGVDEALRLVGDRDAWVIGGEEVYRTFLPLAHRSSSPWCRSTSAVTRGRPCSSAAPGGVPGLDPDHGWHVSSAGGTRYRFETHLRA